MRCKNKKHKKTFKVKQNMKNSKKVILSKQICIKKTFEVNLISYRNFSIKKQVIKTIYNNKTIILNKFLNYSKQE